MRHAIAAIAFTLLAATALPGKARADKRQEACKNAMNARIQVCTDDCTAKALAAASDYVDTNHNVKFGCLKGCALGQITQMKICRDGDINPGGGNETNR